MTATYLNPVYGQSCPDPFVLKHGGEYWGYCTSQQPDGRAFGILHSRDLIHWREVGGAMPLLPGDHTCYWAPEVTYDNGRFYLYYSVGDGLDMHLRVAVARQPGGPFIDSGRRLTTEPFAIDAHVFTDDDGARYLFYTIDLLEHPRIGTGNVADRLLDPFTLAGRPQPIAYPQSDWQIYDPHRLEKGGVCWHTIEGAFVLKQKGRYYQMFSGGNWQNDSYGVSYATTDRIDTPAEWQQVGDPILRSNHAAGIVGPGHNSVVRGPDNRQLFCVYHRWTEDARVLAIDQLEWVGPRLAVLGPSYTPQPAPLSPLPPIRSGFTPLSGHWSIGDRTLAQAALSGPAQARLILPASSFLCEVTLRAVMGRGTFGLSLSNDFALALEPAVSRATIDCGATRHIIALPPDFDFNADHLLRVEVDGQQINLALDQFVVRWQGTMNVEPTALTLDTCDLAAVFTGFELTVGWQDDFVEESLAASWQIEHGEWRITQDELHVAACDLEAMIGRGPALANYEFVVNARLDRDAGAYGFYPAWTAHDHGPLIVLERDDAGWTLRTEAQSLALPDDFDPHIDQQFRFCKQNDRLTIQWLLHMVGELTVPPTPSGIGLYARHAAVAFDLARVTTLAGEAHV